MNAWLEHQRPDTISQAVSTLRESDLGQRYIAVYAAGDERLGLWLYILDTMLVRLTGEVHTERLDLPWLAAYYAGDSPGAALAANFRDRLSDVAPAGRMGALGPP